MTARDARGWWVRLSIAVAASDAIVLAAPSVGEIRAAIQSAFPGSYRTILVTIVACAVVAATVAAVVQIRDRRRLRYGLIAAALLIGIVYARATSSGNAEVDAVERFHFVEYGLIGLLYYGVWYARRDLASLALPLMAGLLVGIADESLQWFVPSRVGEMRDVLLNGAALVCGLLFGLGITPPWPLTAIRDRQGRLALTAMALVTVAAGAGFFSVVHIGHEVSLPPGSTFASRFSAGELAAAARDRASRWEHGLPPEARFSREDHYLSEGRWHVQERNEAVTMGDLRTAWHEELILEAFYAPVLAALPSDRWPATQRAEVEARAGGSAETFTSRAHPHPIYPWRRDVFWAAIAAGMIVIAWAGFGRRRDPGAARAGQPA